MKADNKRANRYTPDLLAKMYLKTNKQKSLYKRCLHTKSPRKKACKKQQEKFLCFVSLVGK